MLLNGPNQWDLICFDGASWFETSNCNNHGIGSPRESKLLILKFDKLVQWDWLLFDYIANGKLCCTSFQYMGTFGTWERVSGTAISFAQI